MSHTSNFGRSKLIIKLQHISIAFRLVLSHAHACLKMVLWIDLCCFVQCSQLLSDGKKSGTVRDETHHVTCLSFVVLKVQVQVQVIVTAVCKFYVVIEGKWVCTQISF